MEIKFCGITRLEDAVWAVESGADAIGFIFYPQSPRYVNKETVKVIMEELPCKVTTVGVFVNQDVEEVRDIVNFCGLDLIQLHGDESPEYCRAFPSSRLIKALCIRNEGNLRCISLYEVKAILVDTYAAKEYGGTGRIANWELARRISNTHPLILAGGLNERNVMEAIEGVCPDALDINSGVESAVGRKDPQKMKRIMEMVRTTQMPGDNKKIFFNLARRGTGNHEKKIARS